jgi:hypothetical protein
MPDCCSVTWCHKARGLSGKGPPRAVASGRGGTFLNKSRHGLEEALCRIPDVAPGTGLVLWGRAAPPAADNPARWQLLQAAGGLSQAEDQVPRGWGDG